MLYLHEVHEVVGACEQEFEAAFRDSWLPRLADGDEARLLYFLRDRWASRLLRSAPWSPWY